ncbi:MAG: hypothetical protein IPH60_08840 [Flavobacteriales bacterium]|nr:hypothetical protein [Flavobacteriales bacterium]
MPARSFAFPLLLVALLAPFSAMFAQKRIKVENLPNFDLHRFHFGFALSYNTSDFQMRMDPIRRSRTRCSYWNTNASPASTWASWLP